MGWIIRQPDPMTNRIFRMKPRRLEQVRYPIRGMRACHRVVGELAYELMPLVVLASAC